MTIFETIGMAWVIFTSALATVAIIYFAFVGLKTRININEESRESDTDVPLEVKEMFKIAR
jgi:hypothetical protein